MDIIYASWPWYVSGPLIALILFILLKVGKRFGMSTNLQTVCAMSGAGKKWEYFNIDWKANRWNLLVAVGAAIGGFIAANYLSLDQSIALHQDVVVQLEEFGITNAGATYLPDELFGIGVFQNPLYVLYLILGGFLVGFGARYAGGCTSGHAISGLSNLQLPSLIAVIGFFIGGLIMVHVLFPILF